MAIFSSLSPRLPCLAHEISCPHVEQCTPGQGSGWSQGALGISHRGVGGDVAHYPSLCTSLLTPHRDRSRDITTHLGDPLALSLRRRGYRSRMSTLFVQRRAFVSRCATLHSPCRSTDDVHVLRLVATSLLACSAVCPLLVDYC